MLQKVCLKELRAGADYIKHEPACFVKHDKEEKEFMESQSPEQSPRSPYLEGSILTGSVQENSVFHPKKATLKIARASID